MLRFGRETTDSFAIAAGREWLATNGLGGFASGSVAGANTRRYHGLLVAALTPPVGRTVLVAAAHVRAHYAATGRHFDLAAAEWAGGAVSPHGFQFVESFWLDGDVPAWTYALDDARLEQRIWMQHGHNTTYLALHLAHATGALDLEITPLCAYRDYHAHGHGEGWSLQVTPQGAGARIDAFPTAVPYWIQADRGTFQAGGEWYWRFRHRVESERGLDDTEDLFAIGVLSATLQPGETLTLVASIEADASTDGPAALAAEHARQTGLLEVSGLAGEPPEVRQLVLAADQFVVARPSDSDPNGRTVIAGYHWFGDWGRDTMIALPGLTLATGRAEVAASVLRTFARFVDRGMLPNRFPDAGETPEYNTVDATLWYFEAVRAYLSAAGDLGLARDLFPVLADIVEWHLRGTRYGIRVDERDGLLTSGEPGVQLTWMDAKIGDWVVTPRTGKAVEINSLWINALRVAADLARRLGLTGARDYEALADRAVESFAARFWHAGGGYLFDVVDGPEGDDASLRPNQLFAVSLPLGPLADSGRREQARRIVDICAQHLLTSYGLRSLSPGYPAYAGTYGGDPGRRDSVYHQGTVWGWLMGPFVTAHYRAYGDRGRARALLLPLMSQLASHCVGSLSEIFDGDPPHSPRGCIAQAWTVAEVLRAWTQLQ